MIVLVSSFYSAFGFDFKILLLQIPVIFIATRSPPSLTEYWIDDIQDSQRSVPIVCRATLFMFFFGQAKLSYVPLLHTNKDTKLDSLPGGL